VVMQLDQLGSISLALQVVILFILILGLPVARGAGSKKNFIRHGYLTVLALVLHTSLTFGIMIPTFSRDIVNVTNLPILYETNVLAHVVLGITAEVLGYVVVGFWVSKPLKNMGCIKARKIMLPIFIIWTLSLVTGALMQIFGIL
jgi:hypothetical protein